MWERKAFFQEPNGSPPHQQRTKSFHAINKCYKLFSFPNCKAVVLRISQKLYPEGKDMYQTLCVNPVALSFASLDYNPIQGISRNTFNLSYQKREKREKSF